MSNAHASQNCLYFRDFTLDLRRGSLRNRHGDVKLRPQSFEVLRILVENHGRLIFKNQLHEQVWRGASVTDDSLTQCVLDIRKAVGDADRDLIKTVPRRGYIFNAPVERKSAKETAEWQTTPSWRRTRVAFLGIAGAITFMLGMLTAAHQTGGASEPLLSQRSIAIHSLRTRSANTNDTIFVDGLRNDLLARVTEIGGINVVSQTAVQPPNRTGQSAGNTNLPAPRSILQGEFQRSGNRVRISVQLVDTELGTYLWAETYDRRLATDNHLDVQSEISRLIATAIESMLLPDRNSIADGNSTSTPTLDSN